jgi:hypothetical protein
MDRPKSLFENVLIRPERRDVPMDFQSYLEIDKIILGNRKFPIRTALQKGNLIFDGFVTRGVLHFSPTPSSPGLIPLSAGATSISNLQPPLYTISAGRPFSKLLGILAKSFNIYWNFFGLLRPKIILLLFGAGCHNS